MQTHLTVEHAIRASLKDRSLNYREVAERVRHAVQGSKTSSKSVASTVSKLRRRGYKVPDRRYLNHV